jgi:hypothetical protein
MSKLTRLTLMMSYHPSEKVRCMNVIWRRNIGNNKAGKVLCKSHKSLNDSKPRFLLSMRFIPSLALLRISPSWRRRIKCLMSSAPTNPVFSQSKTAKHTTITYQYICWLEYTLEYTSNMTYVVTHLWSQTDRRGTVLPETRRTSTHLHWLVLVK